MVDDPDLVADHRARGGQHQLARPTPVGLEDPSQAIELEQGERERTAVPSMLGDQDREPPVEVGAPGERPRLVSVRGGIPFTDQTLGERSVQRAEQLGEPLGAAPRARRSAA